MDWQKTLSDDDYGESHFERQLTKNWVLQVITTPYGYTLLKHNEYENITEHLAVFKDIKLAKAMFNAM